MTRPDFAPMTDYFQLLRKEDQNKLWTPKIIFPNSRNARMPDQIKNNSASFVFADGMVVQTTRFDLGFLKRYVRLELGFLWASLRAVNPYLALIYNISMSCAENWTHRFVKGSRHNSCWLAFRIPNINQILQMTNLAHFTFCVGHFVHNLIFFRYQTSIYKLSFKNFTAELEAHVKLFAVRKSADALRMHFTQLCKCRHNMYFSVQ